MATTPKVNVQGGGAGNPEENKVEPVSVNPVNHGDLQKSWDSLQGLAEMNPAIKESPEYKAIETKMVEVAKSKGLVKDTPGAAAAEEEEEEEEEEEIEDEESDEEEEEEEDGKDKNKKKEDTKPKNAFGLGVKKSASGKKPNPEIEKLDAAVMKPILKTFGTEDPNKFFTEIVPAWRQDSQELAKVKEDYEGLQSELAALPDDIKLILNAYGANEDWKEVINVSTLRPDFNQSFDKLDKENVVKFYYPDKYKSLKQKFEENDDFEEEDFNDHLSTLHAAAKPLFEKDKGQFEKKRADIMASAEKQEKLLKASATSSVEALKKEYSDFSPTQLQKVSSFLVNGEIDSLLKDKNGSYKPEAAKIVALAFFGDELIKDLLEQAENKGSSKANENIALRGKKKVESSKSVENAKQKVVEAATAHLQFSQQEKNPYT